MTIRATRCQLRSSTDQRNAAHQPALPAGLRQTVTEENLGALKEDMERASLFVKCIQQRNHTMRLLWPRGQPAARFHLTVSGTAHRGRRFLPTAGSRSTISRAVANKCYNYQTAGLFLCPIRFDRSLNVHCLAGPDRQRNQAVERSELAQLLAKGSSPAGQWQNTGPWKAFFRRTCARLPQPGEYERTADQPITSISTERCKHPSRPWRGERAA